MATHHYDRPKTHAIWLFQRVGILVIIGLACLFIGCDGNVLEGVSDDDSYEAKLEEGLMALDDEDYDKAVDIFKRLKSDYPNKEEVCVYLSNAYAGLTGIDTFNLLNTIDDLDGTDSEGGIDMIGLLLGSAEGILTQDAVTTKIGSIGDAQTTINGCIDIDNRDTDERVQMGLLGLGDVALIIADTVFADTGVGSIELTEEGLEELYESRPPIDIDDTDISDADLALLNASLKDIQDSIDALEEILGDDEENDLSESFDEFIDDIDRDHSGEITRSEIEQYIDDL